jgi:hypothetical protein
MPQWVRDADKTVWDEDGKNCATWEADKVEAAINYAVKEECQR